MGGPRDRARAALGENEADQEVPEWMRLLQTGPVESSDDAAPAVEEEASFCTAVSEAADGDEAFQEPWSTLIELGDDEAEEAEDAIDMEALEEEAAAAQAIEEEEPENKAGAEFLADFDDLPDAPPQPVKKLQKSAKAPSAAVQRSSDIVARQGPDAKAVVAKLGSSPPAKATSSSPANAASSAPAKASTPAKAVSAAAAGIAQKIKELREGKSTTEVAATSAEEVKARIKALREGKKKSEESAAPSRPVEDVAPWRQGRGDSTNGSSHKGTANGLKGTGKGKGEKGSKKGSEKGTTEGASQKGSKKGNEKGTKEAAGQKGSKKGNEKGTKEGASQKGSKKGSEKSSTEGAGQKGSKKGNEKGSTEASGVKRAASGDLSAQPPAKSSKSLDKVDREGRRYNLDTVVVNIANVGASYGKKCLGREPGQPIGLLDWEGVRRCVRHLRSNAGKKVVAVINENFTATDNNSKQKREMPPDIVKMCETVEETPRLPGFNHSSADDEMTIKCAYRRNCYFLDNDHYRDWKQQLRDEKIRSWLEVHAGFLQMRYFFDKGLGTFDLLEGNVPDHLLAPDKGVAPKQVSKQDLWNAPKA